MNIGSACHLRCHGMAAIHTSNKHQKQNAIVLDLLLRLEILNIIIPVIRSNGRILLSIRSFHPSVMMSKITISIIAQTFPLRDTILFELVSVDRCCQTCLFDHVERVLC